MIIKTKVVAQCFKIVFAYIENTSFPLNDNVATFSPEAHVHMYLLSNIYSHRLLAPGRTRRV